MNVCQKNIGFSNRNYIAFAKIQFPTFDLYTVQDYRS